MVNATHVILCEPLINTALELQAIARVHRIGQHRPTTVWMYIVNETVEESIYDISVKRRMAHIRSDHQLAQITQPGTDTSTCALVSTVNVVDRTVGSQVNSSNVVPSSDQANSIATSTPPTAPLATLPVGTVGPGAGRDAGSGGSGGNSAMKESEIDAANSMELQQAAPLKRLLAKGQVGGELVDQADLWACLFSHRHHHQRERGRNDDGGGVGRIIDANPDDSESILEGSVSAGAGSRSRSGFESRSSSNSRPDPRRHELGGSGQSGEVELPSRPLTTALVSNELDHNGVVVDQVDHHMGLDGNEDGLDRVDGRNGEDITMK